MTLKIVLDGTSLDRSALLKIAEGAQVELAPPAVARVQKAAEFLDTQVVRGEPIYGISTGFGSNADKLLGAHSVRASRADVQPMIELQENLIVTHAVCVGEPFETDVVRAMLAIRINTLLRGHSGIRLQTVEALTRMLNAGVVPVVPKLGSVGASGDLAPLSHLAIVLLGQGEAFYEGERLSGAEALKRAGLAPVQLQHKEGLALNNGTAQMLATGVLAIAKLERLLDVADIAAAMTIEGFAGRTGAFAEEVHALRPHPGQVHVARQLRTLLHGSGLADIPYHLVPKFKTWKPGRWPTEALDAHTFDIQWDWVPTSERHGREKFYTRFMPFRGGKKHQPQDSYSLRCVPQVHGAVRDAVAHAARVFEIELNAVTDNPLVFPDSTAENVDEQVISAGHFHGMPLALAMSAVKAAIPVLASISERRLNKLVDPATNDGLPAFLIGNEDGTESGMMIVQYTAAAIVNDLASRAMPASVYSIPTSANAEDHVSMGANEARHVLDMTSDLAKVLGLEMLVAAQAVDLRVEMLEAARALAAEVDANAFAKHALQGGAATDDVFLSEVDGLRKALAAHAPFAPSPALARVLADFRAEVPYLRRDRALDKVVATAVRWAEKGLPAV
ncbi:HAL/PAL/TAL family ammonia-lyase [Lysobacter soyae]|jgi:histidine ammonia-lyase|uniref:Aromatic amino acid ammonia-lyase n=1 Tax=Lysobacter soyae TaxID=2764185 RepID=A0ABX8WQ19_9GAMM|nr:aromatic amino acid ammonia-lyase [Lysobacter sp. CJ11]QYR52284.1 aromatic amino acid ammonia-lyase [Lysobacter sp. CJ11]